MNCPECGETIFAGSYKCGCGWKQVVSLTARRYEGPINPIQTTEWKDAKDRCLANMRKMNFNKPGNRDWAYKLMERHNAGEVLTPAQYELAYNAVRTDPNRRERMAAE